MPTYALSVLGADRPGIVAAIAETLVAHAVNLTDSQMGVLRGHFAMTLIVEVPGSAASLQRDLEHVAGTLGLQAVALARVDDAAPVSAEPTHTVTVHGPDHTGIVAAVARVLAESGVNVCDLNTRLTGDLYVMFLEVAAPDGVVPDLSEVARAQGVEVSVQPLGDDA